MIKHRLINGAVMIGLLTGALFLPAAAVFLIIPILATMMLWEFYGLLEVGGMPNFRLTGVLLGAVLILLTGLQFGLAWFPGTIESLESILLAGIVLSVFLRQCFDSRPGKPLQQIGATLLGILYVSLLFNFYTKLLLRWDEGDGRYLLFYMILIVKVTDMGAFFTGCSIGRHKLIPRISPAKTWEGCAGGVAAGLATSLLYWWAAGGQIGPVALSVAHAVILGILLPIVGIFGDLFESLLKRAAAVKDSGTVLKGMGGVMDVLDSLLFAAPVLYVFILLTGQ